jgi:hypothetical protein
MQLTHEGINTLVFYLENGVLHNLALPFTGGLESGLKMLMPPLFMPLSED